MSLVLILYSDHVYNGFNTELPFFHLFLLLRLFLHLLLFVSFIIIIIIFFFYICNISFPDTSIIDKGRALAQLVEHSLEVLFKTVKCLTSVAND